MKASGLVFAVVGVVLVGCGAAPAKAPSALEQMHEELAHTIEPVGEATLMNATLARDANPAFLTDEAPAPRTWGFEEVDADLRVNPYRAEN